ncbi:MAG: cohesin domain-containing protein, partial [Candidatus Bathyarchaeota archaeon]
EVIPPTEKIPPGTYDVNVTVKNEGIHAENVTISLYYNSTLIGTQTITNQPSGTTELLTFTWDATSLPAATYVLRAEANTVPGEIYLVDNSKEATVKIGPLAEIRVDPAIAQLHQINETFNLNITMNNLWEGWRTISVQFRLCYDDTLLEVVNVTQGEFMLDPAWNLYGTFFTSFIEVDPVYGPNVLVGILLNPNGTGQWNAFPSGDGTLATITFKGIHQERGLENPPLTCSLILNNTQIIDDEIELVSHSMQHGVYEMYPSNIADINWDGIVDMRDIGLAAMAFGSEPGHPRWNPICDLNNDDKIDMKDIAMVARNFGWVA